MLKKTLFTLLIIFSSLLIFFLLLKQPATKIFCRMQVETKIYDFKRCINAAGFMQKPENDFKVIKEVSKKMYQECLNK